MDALIDVVAEYQDEERPEVRGAWLPATLADADWCLRRIGECEAEIADADQLEAAAIAAVKARTEKLRAGARRGVAYFESVLKAWMERERPSLLKGKAKSRSLVYGKIGWRSRAERVAVAEKTALEPWLRALLRANPDGTPLVRVKVEPVMAEMQRHFAETGEIPPGCVVEPAAEESYVKAEVPGAALAKREE